MRATMEGRVIVGALLAVQLLTSLSGIAMLGRMSPAVDRILTENVYSTEAVEAMLAALAEGDDRASFDAALERARSNITEEGESALLATIDAQADGAWAGRPVAKARLVTALRSLGDVNRASMREADANATRLGLAGAWAMAALGVAGFWAGMVAARRVQRHLLDPLVELEQVLRAANDGDTLRRYAAPAGESPRWVRDLNELLDRKPTVSVAPSDVALREAVIGLLDQHPEPLILCTLDARVIATNAAALFAADAHGGPAALARAVDNLPAPWTASVLTADLWQISAPAP
jgi:hypothetical protein